VKYQQLEGYHFLESKELAERIAELALEKKATNVITMHVRPLTTMADYFVICSGETSTQVKAIADHIVFELKSARNRPLSTEGLSNKEWVLLDYIDVITHVFQPHKREFFALENLWGDAEICEFKDEE